MEQQEVPAIAGGNAQYYRLFYKTVWWFLKNVDILLPYDPAVILLGMYPEESKIYVRIKICTQNKKSKVIIYTYAIVKIMENTENFKR